MTGVTVRPVQRRGDVSAFLRLPHDLYRDDPHWVPPADSEARAFLSPRHNPFFDSGTAQLFLARRAGRTVGRIAAVVDRRYLERHDADCGQLGLFECVDDGAVASALFAAAARWLRGHGLNRAIGPLSFTVNDECGLLVDGFGAPPTTGMPHNPAYYPRLFADCGFTKAKDLYSWHAPVPADGQCPPLIRRAAQRALDDPDVLIRPLDAARFDADLATVKRIYNEAWERNYAAVPVTDREFALLAQRLKAVIRPGLLQIATVRGEPAGFTLWVPDVNQARRPGAARPPRWRQALGALGLRHGTAGRTPGIDRTRASTSGVLGAYRGRGLMAALFCRAQRAAAELGYRENEFSWILEDNRDANRHARAMGGRHVRTHRLYTRELEGLA
ncbi:GNAT family N-acetyltransferase [Streptomyces gamaensis]|uniref:GNAT family N-acetyltransferase n=1 Tax=Streptomyces gamaensis TaxID=1763542 RepID=A0ABW0ZA89_9ACTN